MGKIFVPPGEAITTKFDEKGKKELNPDVRIRQWTCRGEKVGNI